MTVSRVKSLWQIVLVQDVMDSLNMSIWCCQYLCRRTKIQIFRSLVFPLLCYGHETQSLNGDEEYIDAFGNKNLSRIMGYCWNDCVKLAITLWDWIVCIIHECQLWVYWCTAWYPVSSALCCICKRQSCVEEAKGHLHSSWLEQVDGSCCELHGMGKCPAWRLAWKNPWKGHHRMVEPTRPLVCAPIDWLTKWVMWNFFCGIFVFHCIKLPTLKTKYAEMTLLVVGVHCINIFDVLQVWIS